MWFVNTESMTGIVGVSSSVEAHAFIANAMMEPGKEADGCQEVLTIDSCEVQILSPTHW